MIKVLIADDEDHARLRLKKLLLKHKGIKIVFEAQNGNQAYDFLISNKIDAAFLDINMPGKFVFPSIKSLIKAPLIIFQTAYSEYAVDAFGIEALDYLLKPIDEQRLTETIIKIKKALSYKKNNIIKETKKADIKAFSVKLGNEIKLIQISDIILISFENGFCYIHTNENKFLSDRYLKYYEEILDQECFFRTSRTHIVNIKNIQTIHKMFKGNYMIELKNDCKINLSRRQAKILRLKIDF